jgi:hypothetical protein
MLFPKPELWPAYTVVGVVGSIAIERIPSRAAETLLQLAAASVLLLRLS